MGLMKCPDCKSEVSDRLDACPKCGCPFTEEIKKEALQAEEPKAPAESEYTIEELADGAGNIFKVQRECVVAALKVAGVTTCTVSKAKELVDAFMKKEVK